MQRAGLEALERQGVRFPSSGACCGRKGPVRDCGKREMVDERREVWDD